MSEPPAPPTVIKRHTLATRLWHWVTAVSVFVMIGSGLMIFNAHPQLYWGQYGANFDRPWLALPRFPGWATIPESYNLAMGRRWHLAFALVLAFALLAFMIASLINRHFQRDLRVRRGELGVRHLWDDFRAHLAFRFHDPERPGDYNIFQKLSYVAVIFVLLPLLILTGLTLSPGMTQPGRGCSTCSAGGNRRAPFTSSRLRCSRCSSLFTSPSSFWRAW